MTDRVVYLVTGAIGAGKTTLSRHLLPLLSNVEYIGADYYFYPYFWRAEKSEHLCYEEAKEYTKYKILQALKQGKPFLLEKTFSSDEDLSLFAILSQHNYCVITFFVVADCLATLQYRSDMRSRDGWYSVSPKKVEHHWCRAQELFEPIRARSDCFYAIDTSKGYKFVLCEEKRELLYYDPNYLGVPLLTKNTLTSKINRLAEGSELINSVYRHILDNYCHYEFKITDSMAVLANYSALQSGDLLEIERIKSQPPI